MPNTFKTCNCARPEEPAIQIFRVLFVWTSTKNEWNAKNAIWSHAFGPPITWNLRTAQSWGKSVLTFGRSRLLTLLNLWLLLIQYYKYVCRNNLAKWDALTNVLRSRFSYIDATGPNCFNAPCKILLPTKCTAKSISWSPKRPQIQLNNRPSLSLDDVIADTNRYINTQKHRNIYGPHEFSGRGNSHAVQALRARRVYKPLLARKCRYIKLPVKSLLFGFLFFQFLDSVLQPDQPWAVENQTLRQILR